MREHWLSRELFGGEIFAVLLGSRNWKMDKQNEPGNNASSSKLSFNKKAMA